MIAERREPQDPEHNQRNDPRVDQHAEHQSLVHDREHLPTLSDQSKPLGPWRDESGRRCVHRSAGESLADLVEGLPGSGASGSLFASRTGLVIGFAAATAGLSTDFLAAGLAAITAFLVTNWAAARPG